MSTVSDMEDQALRDLLHYCQTKANGDDSYPEERGRNAAYGDVADRLEAILDPPAPTPEW